MKIIGIDPSWATTGLACISGNREIGYKYEESITIRIRADVELEERHKLITQGVARFILLHRPSLIVVEHPGYFLRPGGRARNINAEDIIKLHWSLAWIVGILNDMKLLSIVEFHRVDKSRSRKVVPLKGSAQQACLSRWDKKLNTHEADAAMLALRGHQTT